MLRLASLTLALYLALWGLGQIALQLSSLSDPLPTYLETGDCPLPCWQGLRPGVTRTATFWTDLNYQVQQRGAWMYSGYTATRPGEDITLEINLSITPSPQIRLGDALLIYGPPDFVRVVDGATLGRSQNGRQALVELYLYWAGGYMLIVATPVNIDAPFRLDMHMPLRQLNLLDPQAESPLGLGRPWRGFRTPAAYLSD